MTLNSPEGHTHAVCTPELRAPAPRLTVGLVAAVLTVAAAVAHSQVGDADLRGGAAELSARTLAPGAVALVSGLYGLASLTSVQFKQTFVVVSLAVTSTNWAKKDKLIEIYLFQNLYHITHSYSLVQIRRHLVTSVVDVTVVFVEVVVVVLLVDVLTAGLVVTMTGGGRVTMSSTQSRTGPPAMLLVSV